MKIIKYYGSHRNSELIEKTARCDWSAARFLVELLQKGTFHATLNGEDKFHC